MSDVDVIVKHTRNHNNQIKKICDPLFRHLGFNGFLYHHISNDGHATSLGSELNSFEFYYFNDLHLLNPFVRHPKFFQTSLHLIPDVQDVSYQDTLMQEAVKFDVTYRMIFLEKTETGCQGFSFATPKKCSGFVNDISMLQCFIKYFKEEASSILKKILHDQRRVDTRLGAIFHTKPEALENRRKNERVEFLKKLGLIHSTQEIDLTGRETDCMKLLLQGYTASQIAQVLTLSKRTVEHYIEKIKIKSNCDTKLELISKFKEIETFGLL